MSNSGVIAIKIDLVGIGSIKGHMIRHFAPLSADAILKKLPIVLRGRFSFGTKNYWTLPGIEIFKGSNPKSMIEVESGDIVYNPKTDELIFILSSINMPNKVNRVGKITEGLDLFQKARNGISTKIMKT